MAKRRILIVSIIGVFIIGIVILLLLKGGFGSSDAERYYKENGDVLSKVKVEESKTLHTEAEIISDMTDRGFGDYPVMCNYSLDGEFNKETEISEDSNDKHPIYDTSFAVGDDKIWIVTTTNGSVTAYPLFHPRNANGIEILYSETPSIWSYDIDEGDFFETIPDESALDLRVVDRIDAATLSDLTKEVSNE